MNNTASQPVPFVPVTPGAHPVQVVIDPPVPSRRVHVVARAVFLLALATVSVSSVVWVLYLVLPALAALLITNKGSERAVAEDGPRTIKVLRWLASANAYVWLLTDVLPTSEPASGAVKLSIQTEGAPTPTTALLRLVYSLPALVLVAVLNALAVPFWLVGAIWILAARRIPDVVRDFLTFTLRYQFRFAAYHLSLVERYPTFG
jgi:hypothetical protein